MLKKFNTKIYKRKILKINDISLINYKQFLFIYFINLYSKFNLQIIYLFI